MSHNRIVAAPISGDTIRYSYAPGNKRVWRGSTTVDELTYYSAGGAKLVAYNLSASGSDLRAVSTGYYEYFGGKLLKNAQGWVNQDRLGSIGKYFPYGEERPSATANGKEKFATYTRDAETGLDYAQNRYHWAGQGRFLTADPYGGSAHLKDPGTWNRYAYVGGDPINRLDPNGEKYIWVSGVNGEPGYHTWVDDSAGAGGGGLGGGGGDEPIVCLPGSGCMPLSMACGLYGNDGGYGYGCGGPEEAPSTQGDGTGTVKTTNWTDDSPLATQARGVLKWIVANLSADSECEKWLNGAPGANVYESIDYILYGLDNDRGSKLGVGNIALNGNQIYNAVAGTTGTTGIPEKTLITINTEGAFFKKGAPSGIEGISGGTAQAQLAIMLHELAHVMYVPGFASGDQGDLQVTNNEQLMSNCGGLIMGGMK